jgi:hypothetical protein
MAICGWCGEPLKGVMGAVARGGRAPATALANAASSPTSHGMCTSCLTDRLAALVRPAPGQMPVAAARPY